VIDSNLPSCRSARVPLKAWLVGALFLVFMAFAVPSGESASPSKSKKVLEVLQSAERVLWLGAHPDDETSSSAFLARAKDVAGTLYMASLTRGENSDKLWGGLRRGTSVGNAREALFKKSASVFHADGYDVGPFVNGPYSIDELDALAPNAPFHDWPSATTSDDVIKKWSTEGDPIGYIVGLLRAHRPDVVISMDDYCGVSGHDEHIAVGKLLRQALPMAADPSSYTESGEPWQVRDVIWTATVLKPLVACRYCKCEGLVPVEPAEDVFSLDKSKTHQLTYMGVQCLVGRSYQNAVEMKGWTDAQMRASCEQAQAAVARAYRSGVKGSPFFESFRYHAVD
jgi:LmbE family N-acetylglucosaminyl deacetylase